MMNNNQPMGDPNVLGNTGQDMAAPGVAGGTNPATGQVVAPSPAVNTNPIATVNNKALSTIGAGSKVVDPYQNSTIPPSLTAAGGI
jgi:hypothetical protein